MTDCGSISATINTPRASYCFGRDLVIFSWVQVVDRLVCKHVQNRLYKYTEIWLVGSLSERRVHGFGKMWSFSAFSVKAMKTDLQTSVLLRRVFVKLMSALRNVLPIL